MLKEGIELVEIYHKIKGTLKVNKHEVAKYMIDKAFAEKPFTKEKPAAAEKAEPVASFKK